MSTCRRHLGLMATTFNIYISGGQKPHLSQTLIVRACTSPPRACSGRLHSGSAPLPSLRSSRAPRGPRAAKARSSPRLASAPPRGAACVPAPARRPRAAPGRPGVPGVAVHLVHVVGVRQATRSPRVYLHCCEPTRSGEMCAAPHRLHQPPAGGRPRRECRHQPAVGVALSA